MTTELQSWLIAASKKCAGECLIIWGSLCPPCGGEVVVGPDLVPIHGESRMVLIRADGERKIVKYELGRGVCGA